MRRVSRLPTCSHHGLVSCACVWILDPRAMPGDGGHSPYYFRGDEQLVALKVFSELTQAAAIGDFFPKLVTKEGETRE